MNSGTNFSKPAGAALRGENAPRHGMRRRKQLSAGAVALISTLVVILVLFLVALYIYYNPADYPDIVLSILPRFWCI